jgi:hypothetical protein
MQTPARFKFTSRIAPPNCALKFTQREKSSATIFHHGVITRFSVIALMRCKPYPLSRQGFYGSPIARRKLRGVPRDGRAMGAKHPARNPAKYLASCPRNFPAMAGQWQQQCRRTSVKTTRKTARLAPDLAGAMFAPEVCEITRNLAAQQPRNISQDDSSESRRHVFNHPVLKL